MPGLGGKGTVDILIGVDNWKQTKETIEKLKKIGFFHFHPKEKGRMLFCVKPVILCEARLHTSF